MLMSSVGLLFHTHNILNQSVYICHNRVSVIVIWFIVFFKTLQASKPVLLSTNLEFDLLYFSFLIYFQKLFALLSVRVLAMLLLRMVSLFFLTRSYQIYPGVVPEHRIFPLITDMAVPSRHFSLSV